MSGGWDGNAEALAKLLRAFPEVVLVVDRDGVIRYVNHVEEGYNRDDVIGMQPDDIMLPESKQVFRATLASVLDEGKEAEYESKTVAPDGRTQWYRSRMIPIHHAGEVDGALVIATNVSELRAAREEIDKLRRLLPLCAWCERIRNEKGTWETIEAYLEEQSGTKVSHVLCPQCERNQLDSVEGDHETNGNVA